MDVAVEEDRLVVRLDPGEEVLERLDALREEHGIDAGFFMGIGAVDRAVLGHYDVAEQEYREEEVSGQFEVTSFLGNIGPDKIHAHIALGKDDFSVIGGHCSGARVSGTFEIVIFRGETPLLHERDETTGLDVFSF